VFRWKKKPQKGDLREKNDVNQREPGDLKKRKKKICRRQRGGG